MSVLRFLAKFKSDAATKGIFKGTAKLVLPYFLTGNARVAYDNALHIYSIDGSSVGIKSWSEAIK